MTERRAAAAAAAAAAVCMQAKPSRMCGTKL
jgi:hypothetical protein